MEEPIADSRNPAAMTPHERRQEIAAILARGVLRLRQAGQTCPGSRSFRTPVSAGLRIASVGRFESALDPAGSKGGGGSEFGPARAWFDAVFFAMALAFDDDGLWPLKGSSLLGRGTACTLVDPRKSSRPMGEARQRFWLAGLLA